MNRNTLARVAGSGAAFLPFAALAQSVDESYFTGLITAISNVLDVLIPVLIGLAVVMFFIGVIRYVTAGDDPEKRTGARNMMIYGIIAIFVMVAVWGLVQILIQTVLGGDIGTPPAAPDLPTN